MGEAGGQGSWGAHLSMPSWGRVLVAMRTFLPPACLHVAYLVTLHYFPSAVAHLRTYWRSWRLLMVMVFLDGVLSFPSARRRVIPVMKIWASPLIGLLMLDEKVAREALREVYSTLSLAVFIATNCPSEAYPRAPGIALSLFAASSLTFSIIPLIVFKVMKKDSQKIREFFEEMFYINLMVLLWGVMVDDLQAALGPGQGESEGRSSRRVPWLPHFTGVIVCTSTFLFCHVRIRSLLKIQTIQ